jgi:hypothetical protein
MGCEFELCNTNFYIKPKAKDVLPEWTFHLFELGGDKKPIYVRDAWSFPMHWELNMICSVPQNLFPGFSS